MNHNMIKQKRLILLHVRNKKLDYNQQILTSQTALINFNLIRNLPVYRPLTSAYLTNILAYLTIHVSNYKKWIFLNTNWSNLTTPNE